MRYDEQFDPEANLGPNDYIDIEDNATSGKNEQNECTYYGNDYDSKYKECQNCSDAEECKRLTKKSQQPKPKPTDRSIPLDNANFKLLDRRLKYQIKKSEEIALLKNVKISNACEEQTVTLEELEYNLPKEYVNPIKFTTRKKVFLEDKKVLKQYIDYINKEYSQELRSDEDKWSKKWMLGNKGIRNMLVTKGSKEFLPIMNYLCKNTLTQPESIKVAEKVGAGTYRGVTKKDKAVNYDFVLLKKLNYENMVKQLGISKNLIQLYLKELCQIGILRKFGKYGPREQTLYAIGYYLINSCYIIDYALKNHYIIWPYLLNILGAFISNFVSIVNL